MAPTPFPLGSPPPWHSYYNLPSPPESISPQTPQTPRRMQKKERQPSPFYPLTPPLTVSPSPHRSKRLKTTPSTPSPIGPVSQIATSSKNPASESRSTPKATHIPPTSESSVKLHHSPPKGFGIHTTRAIARGEEILREKPFITFSHPVESRAIQTAFQVLSPEDKILFLSFTGICNGEEPDIFVDIAETNAIPCSTEEDDTALPEEEIDVGGSCARKGKGKDKEVEEASKPSGLFERICRVNHSCAPNAGWRWCKHSNELLLLDYIDIPLETEITASYIEHPATNRQDRQDHLKERFGFDCACLRCAPGDPSILDASEDAMREYHEIIQPLTKKSLAIVARNPYRALQIINDAIGILKQEGLVQDLAEFYIWKFQVYALWGVRSKAMNIAMQLKDQFRTTLGVRAMEASEYRYWWTTPEVYSDWAVYGKRLPVGRRVERADSADSYTE